MNLFLSYTSSDRDKIRDLQAGLHSLGYSVWLDQELSGGQPWWDHILLRLRESEAVVVAVSPALTLSEACKREVNYAQRLSKPVLPVMVDTVRVDMLPPWLAALQIVDFRTPDGTAAFALARAIRQLPATGELPDPLPDPPAVPISYIGELLEWIRQPQLSLNDQLAIVGKLKLALSRPSERDAIGELIRVFNDREDLFYAVARELATLSPTPASLSSWSPEARTEGGDRPAATEPSGTAVESAGESASAVAMTTAPTNGREITATEPPTGGMVGHIAANRDAAGEREIGLEPAGDMSTELIRRYARPIAMFFGGGWIAPWLILYVGLPIGPLPDVASFPPGAWFRALFLAISGVTLALLMHRFLPPLRWRYLALIAGSWPVFYVVWAITIKVNFNTNFISDTTTSTLVFEAYWLVGVFTVGVAWAWSVLHVRTKPRLSLVLLVSASSMGAWLVFGSSLTVWAELVDSNLRLADPYSGLSRWLFGAGLAVGAFASGIAGSLLIYRFLRASERGRSRRS
jgi:TIR domain-containing protein